MRHDAAAGDYGAGHDPRHVPVHGARASRGQRGRRAHRHLRVRQRALRDDHGEEGVRGEDADESRGCHSRARPTTAHHRAAARAPTRRLHRPKVPGEKPGRPVADRVRFGIALHWAADDANATTSGATAVAGTPRTGARRVANASVAAAAILGSVAIGLAVEGGTCRPSPRQPPSSGLKCSRRQT